MANAAAKIADKFTQHSTDILRVEAGLRKQVTGMLNGLSNELKLAIQEVDPTAPVRRAYRVKRTNNLIAISNSKINKAYDGIIRTFEKDMVDLARAEAINATTILNKVLTVNLLQPVTDPAVYKALVDGTMFEGAPQKAWWRGQKRGFKESFERQMQAGVIAGESTRTLTNRIIGNPITGTRLRAGGTLKTAKRKAETLVRTSVTSVVNAARADVYKKNSDVVKGQQWLATLDQRTSDICQSLDGEAWDLDGQPIQGSTTVFVGPPPAHFNCRSVLVPVLKSWSELNKNPKISKKLAAVEKKMKRRVASNTRASMDGQVSSKMNYEQWLRNKEKRGSDVPLKVLGPAKHALWKSGKLKFSDMIDQSWNPKSVGQLKAEIERRAGLLKVKKIPTKVVTNPIVPLTTAENALITKATGLDASSVNGYSTLVDNGVAKGMTEIEARAVLHYTSHNSYRINKGIRTGTALSAEDQAIAKAVNNGLARAKKYKGTVIREITSKSDIAEWIKRYPVGSKASGQGFLSTSYEKSVYQRGYTTNKRLKSYVWLEIKSKSGVNIDNMSFIGGEKEVLFSSKARYKVKSVTSYKGNADSLHIVMEEL